MSNNVAVIQQKIHLAAEALSYLGARPLDPNYDPVAEADQLEIQRHHFIDVLDDLNVQLALVIANSNSVVPPNPIQASQVIVATTAVEQLNANQAIGTATVNVLNGAFAAAQPLLKA